MSFGKTVMFSSPPKQSIRKGPAVERWEKELLRVFDGQITEKLVVEDKDFLILNSSNLTNKFKTTKKITLRTARQGYEEAVSLKRFDPNFMSSTEIICRCPGCKQKKKRKSPSSKISKEDLYLCPAHRKLVENYVTKICVEKRIVVSTKYSPEDFEGYTSTIGLLESVLFGTRPAGSESALKGKPTILREVFLNLRNFLMITNVLLNPDEENLLTALGRPMEILMAILKSLNEDGENLVARLRELVGVLRSMIEYILFAFGVIYSWVYLALVGNPGAQLGAGIGGIVGMTGLFAGPAVGILAMVGGSLFGGLTGSGIYNLQQQERQEEDLRRYQEYVQIHRNQEGQNEAEARVVHPPAENNLQRSVYYITGSETGDLTLFILLHAAAFGLGI